MCYFAITSASITSASTIYIDPAEESFDEMKWKFSNRDRINFLFDIIDNDPKDDYLYLYHHIPWIEDEVNDVLKNQYSWEGSSDTTTTWRVGDGTAAFYNYIYYVVAGFTEHDTFRSNQIREGMISRKEALEYVSKENQPRWETLEWYAKVIGFNIDHALQVIHKMPKLYGR